MPGGIAPALAPLGVVECLSMCHLCLSCSFVLQVVDEADTMFAEGWGAELGELLKPLRAKEEPAHVVLVSATMTKVGRMQRVMTTTTIMAYEQVQFPARI